MINKLSIKLGAWLLIATALFPYNALAADLLMQGQPIAATPFDPKVFSTGIFVSDRFSFHPEHKRSVDELFAVARSFRYVHTANKRWQTPEETQMHGSGDCADKSVWLYAQLKENGYENVRLVIGKYRQVDPTFHVWVVYTDENGRSLLLDPTLQRRAWENGNFNEGFYKALYSYDGESRYRYF